MKTKLNPFLAGSFVLVFFVVAIAALVSLRSCHLISKPGRFMSYFKESVSGLDAGSAVKLHGVRVGSVKSIGIHFDSATRQSLVVVMAELDQNVVSDPAGKLLQLTDRHTLEKLIGAGLRAKVGLAGITGLQFVQLDFVDPQAYPAQVVENPPQYPVIPTVPSGMSEMAASLSKIVGDLTKVDFSGISREMKSLLAKGNQQIDELDLKPLVTKLAAAASSIDALASSPEAKAALTNLNRTAVDVQALVAKLNTRVDPASQELSAALVSIHDAAESVRKLFGTQNATGLEAAKTLQQLNDTAESIQRLADLLERNPNVLITGKKPPGKER